MVIKASTSVKKGRQLLNKIYEKHRPLIEGLDDAVTFNTPKAAINS